MEYSYIVYFESNGTNAIHPVRVFNHPFDTIQYCNKKAFRMVSDKNETFYINSKGKYYIKMVSKKIRRPN